MMWVDRPHATYAYGHRTACMLWLTVSQSMRPTQWPVTERWQAYTHTKTLTAIYLLPHEAISATYMYVYMIVQRHGLKDYLHAAIAWFQSWCLYFHRSLAAVGMYTVCHHRLRGSASPVLTATRHSYGSPRLSDFFDLGSGGQTPQRTYIRKMAQTTCFHARMCLFAVKIATFHTPWSPGPLKGQNLANFWT